MFNDDPIIKSSQWIVTISGIPYKLNEGMEVSVNFKSFNITNNNTFYTDSNSLEMQKRVFNQRIGYNYSTIF